MVRTQLQARGISDPKILEAMSRLPRHRFVPGSGGSEATGISPCRSAVARPFPSPIW